MLIEKQYRNHLLRTLDYSSSSYTFRGGMNLGKYHGPGTAAQLPCPFVGFYQDFVRFFPLQSFLLCITRLSSAMLLLFVLFCSRTYRFATTVGVLFAMRRPAFYGCGLSRVERRLERVHTQCALSGNETAFSTQRQRQPHPESVLILHPR